MIDENLAGTVLTEFTTSLDRSQIRLYAKAIGENRSIYSDVEAARAQGHDDIVVPPTMLISLLGDGTELQRALQSAGADLRTMLHGEQSFTFTSVPTAGQPLSVSTAITDVYSKKGGALQFVVQESVVKDASSGPPVATMTMTFIFRNGG